MYGWCGAGSAACVLLPTTCMACAACLLTSSLPLAVVQEVMESYELDLDGKTYQAGRVGGRVVWMGPVAQVYGSVDGWQCLVAVRMTNLCA